jgi:hypothetical protein
MIGEAGFHGLYVPWLMLLCGVTLGVQWLVHRLLGALGVYRWVWHPALFDTALYVLLPYVVSRVASVLQLHWDPHAFRTPRPRPPAAGRCASRACSSRSRWWPPPPSPGCACGITTNSSRGRATAACAPTSCRSRPTCRASSPRCPCRTTSPWPRARCCSRRIARFTLAQRQAESALGAAKVALVQAQRENARNVDLGNLISQELREQTGTRVEAAQANVAQAAVALDAARLNLDRAMVRAPTDGLVTNLDMRTGSYAQAGRPALALADAKSFYVEDYFEETKLPRIHVGDRVRVTPMGGARLEGTVESIADRDRTTGTNLLPSVNPTFNWVRLAQRIPVRVKLDPLAAGTRPVAGETVTVQVVDASEAVVIPRPAATADPGSGSGSVPVPVPVPAAAAAASTSAKTPAARS